MNESESCSAATSTPPNDPEEVTALVNGRPVVIWWSFTHRLSARLIERTATGAVIIAPIRDPFELGFQVRVDENEGKEIANVDSISRLEDGAYRISLVWAD